MSTIVTRAGKGSPLTNNEVDANFVNLNTDKIQTLTSTDASVTITGTGSSRDLSVVGLSGAVIGPASSVSGRFPSFNGTTGKLIQDSGYSAASFATAAQGTKADNAVSAITSGDGSVIISPTGTLYDLSVGTAASTGNLIAPVRNQTGSTITKGTLVYISGGAGNKAIVSLAQANGESTSAGTFGMVNADINNNANGYVTITGQVSGLNTSAYTEGTVLYLSPTVAGGYTNVKPSAPNHMVYIGTVIYSHATQGTIQTRIQNGYELDEIHNVAISSVADQQLLQFESSTNLWKNKSVLTTSIGEGTNLYYTDARVRLAISGAAPLSYSSSTGVFSIPAATSSANGYLTNTDWSTFNNKQPTLVSGTNIKTINGSSVLGSGDLVISGGDPAGTAVAMAIALG